jgi:hypothetical protein
MIFLFFLKLFLRSAYQNNPKHTKKLIFNKKKLNFLEMRIGPRFQMQTKLLVYYVHHKELLQ